MKKVTFITYSVIFFSFSLFFLQCKTAVPSTSNIKLNGNTWYFTGMIDEEKKAIEFPKAYMISFEEKSFGIYLDKNSCRGSYKVQGDQEIFVDNIGTCTQICCDSESAEKLKAALTGKFKIEKTATGLKLVGTKNRFNLAQVKPEKPKTTLANTTWDIYKVSNQENEWLPKKPYKVKFSENDINIRFEANSCNGACSFGTNQITFSGITCTEMCCDSKEAQKLYAAFNGTMQYAMEGEKLVISDKTLRLYLSPAKADVPTEEKTLNAAAIIGKSYQVYDVVDRRKGTAMTYATAYRVSFDKAGFSIKLEVNTCNTPATYEGSKVTFANVIGCTKACCDSQPASELARFFNGTFEISQSGEYLKLSSDAMDIRLK